MAETDYRNFSNALFMLSSSFFSKMVVMIIQHEKLKTKAMAVKSHGSFESDENHPQTKIIITRRIKQRINKMICRNTRGSFLIMKFEYIKFFNNEIMKERIKS